MERRWQETTVVWLLRAGGAMTSAAWLTMVMPTESMAAIHAWLGLGEFPRAPITEYLTRTISGMYAVHGGLLLVVSTDVRRFRPLVVYLAIINVVIGAAFLAVDLEAGMPTWWTVSEGPPILLIGLAMLYLLRGVRPDECTRSRSASR